MAAPIQEEPHPEEEEEKEDDDTVMNKMNIVVAVDESQESMHACKWACKYVLAAHTNARQCYNFTLLYVHHPVSVSSGPAYIFSSEVLRILKYDEAKTTKKILKRALDICNRYNVKAKTYVVTGDPKEKICEVAQKLEAYFLVMGSHDHGLFIRAIMGSVSDYCSRNATCPVVVVNKKVLQQHM